MKDKTNKVINRIIEVVSKIAEVCLWIGTAGFIVICILLAIAREDLLHYVTDFTTDATEISLMGSQITIQDASLGHVTGVFIVCFIMATIMCVLLALVCRNINLIFKTTEGKTKFSRGATPFQPANVRMIREIGIFLIAVPIIEIIMNCISAGVAMTLGVTIATDVDFFPLFIGLIVLALSQFFAYGVKLQEDVDGLL